MTAHVALSCDGTRNGQPCRGAYHARTLSLTAALAEAGDWRTRAVGHLLVLRCPSAGHDQEEGW